MSHNSSVTLRVAQCDTDLNVTVNCTRLALDAWDAHRDGHKLWFLVTMFACLVGAGCHLMLFCVIFMINHHRRGSGRLILHLVCIELLVCIFFGPAYCVITMTTRYHMTTDTFCTYELFVYMAMLYTGHWAMFLLAFNRFVALVFPRNYARFSSGLAFCWMTGTAWVVGIGASLPFVAGWGGYYGVTPVWGNCGLTHATVAGREFFGLIQIATVYLPAGLLTLLYITILVKHKCPWLHIGVDINNARPDGAPDEIRRFNGRVALAKILCASSIWHCLCHFPGAIITSTTLVDIYVRSPLLQLWLYTMFLCGYALNPAFFFLMSREYRRETLALSLSPSRITLLMSRTL
ncbi:hypothetical protein BV898_17476 [Hypsibius exemplaris]|uniref:G-protein coupled receptors family 1 profile domain-containing protein n=1 Tax=Hypsibius exemplaris TaxID=2072580 RepID=A0A9X6NF56_HYPEX|nr:hypothetical protein BV898_17476 [Hypsibius exemplaris]